MIKNVLIAVSLAMTIGIYYPAFKRIWKRQHTRDFSKISSWFIFLVQVNNLILAIAEKAPYLSVWYIVQSTLCGIQLYLIYQFWNSPDPRFK